MAYCHFEKKDKHIMNKKTTIKIPYPNEDSEVFEVVFPNCEFVFSHLCQFGFSPPLFLEWEVLSLIVRLA